MGKYINTKDLELEVSHYLQCEKESETITLEELKEITNRLPSFEHYRGADMCDFYIDVKHGKWVNPEMGYEDCSVCGYCFAVYDEHEYLIERNFCPNCGADMRGETNE